MAITDELLDRLRMAESGGNPRAVSPAGALGAYQFMPATARQFGIDPMNEQQSREAARKYLTQLHAQFGNVDDALRAYNWGPGNMAAYVKTGYGAKGQPMPQETQKYVRAVQGNSGRDLSALLVGEQPQQAAGRDLSAELGAAPATERPGAFMRAAQGVAQGIVDPINSVSQMLTRAGAAVGLPGSDAKVAEFDKYVKDLEARYKRDVRGGQNDLDFGRMGGNVITTLPIAMAAPVAGTLASAAAIGAGTGALSGAMQPVTEGNFWEEKRKQMLTGAAGGSVFGAGGKVLSGMISPTVSPQVALLRKEGVVPTPGQILGDGFKTAEEKLTSVPVLGSAISGGQQRANEQFNQAAWNRVLKPLNEKLPDGMVGREAAQFVWERKNQAYDTALNAVGPIAMDRQLVAAMNAVKSTSGLPPKVADELEGLIQTNVFNWAQNGYLTPEALKGATSELRRLASGYKSDPAFANREIGQSLQKAHQALQDAITRQAPPQAAAQLKAANKAYANYVRAERAADSVGAINGVFTPAQLQRAVRAEDRTKSGFARGASLMQDLSDAGRSVLTRETPDSGTAGRLLPAIAGGAATINPWLMAGLAPAVMYTPTGQRLMASMLTGRQGAGYGLLSDASRRLAAPAGAVLTPALQGLLNQ